MRQYGGAILDAGSVCGSAPGGLGSVVAHRRGVTIESERGVAIESDLTPQREPKRMARLLIADVTLLKSSEVRAQLRFKGGATHTLTLPLPKSAWMLRQTPETIVPEINRLLDDHTEGEIADLLNSKGVISGEGKRFNRTMVARIRSNYNLEARYSRLRARGMLTLA